MTRNELSQKICEGISAVFGRAPQNPENWLYEQDYVRGRVSITEHATSARDAMGICDRLEKAIGGVKVSSTSRADESYVFTIDFAELAAEKAPVVKNESVYTDGKNTVASIEKDGKKYMVDASGHAVPVEDADKYISNLNKTTGSSYRKAEELIDERLQQAATALEGTGYKIAREEGLLRISGPKSETLAGLCTAIPAGDEYYGSGVESDDEGNDTVVLVLPPEILGVEEILAFIDKAVVGVLDDAEKPEPKGVDAWTSAISSAVPDTNMARRMSFMKNSDGLALALSDEKFAQAVASVRDVYGNDKAEAVMTLRLGAKMARSVIEALGPTAVKAAPQASESLVTGAHRASPGVSAIIAQNTIKK